MDGEISCGKRRLQSTGTQEADNMSCNLITPDYMVQSRILAQTPLVRFVADLLWTCCGFAVQLVAEPIQLTLHLFDLLWTTC
jgi:hypothetical protein